MTEPRVIKKNGTPRAKVLGLPGFIWKPCLGAGLTTKAYKRTISAIMTLEDAGEAVKRFEDGRTYYTSAAVMKAFEADSHNVTMKTDDEKIWIEYKGVRWFETEAAYVRSGVPADRLEAPKPAEPAAEAIDLSPIVSAHLVSGGPISVDVSFILHNAPAERLAHGHLHGYAESFQDVRALADALHAAKYGLPASAVPALEIEVAASELDYPADPEAETLTLWFPAKNDETAEGYGVTVSTEPHAAAMARKRAALRLEAIRRSTAGERITVAEMRRFAGSLALDPLRKLIADAPGYPEPGWKYVAHFEHGRFKELWLITGGTQDCEKVMQSAKEYSLQNEDVRGVGVYRIMPRNGGPDTFVYVPDGSGRVIVTDNAVILEGIYKNGSYIPVHPNIPPMRPSAPAFSAFRPAAEPEAPAEPLPIEDIPPEVLERADSAPKAAEVCITLAPLDLKPVAAFYEAVLAFYEGQSTLLDLGHALSSFENFVFAPKRK